MDESVLKLIMAIPEPGHGPDPMKPGMHGETKGPSGAEDLLCKIKCMIDEYFGEECPKPDQSEEEPEKQEEA